MVIKILLLSLFLVSCGQKVSLSSNKLENIQLITEGQVKQYQKSATLNTTDQTIIYGGSAYKVSIYSSKAATDFIAAQPKGAQIPVLFTGGISGQEIVLEAIERQ
jgi:hypothetical protein